MNIQGKRRTVSKKSKFSTKKKAGLIILNSKHLNISRHFKGKKQNKAYK